MTHAELVEGLRVALAKLGHRIGRPATTSNLKRPDLVTLSNPGLLWVWEAKTRFTPLERTQAWRKYSTSADHLVIAYPPSVNLDGWQAIGWLPADPTARYCGCVQLDSGTLRWHHSPRLIQPIPHCRTHLLSRAFRETSDQTAPTPVLG